MDTLAIVILNYNGQSFLARFLPSVCAHADGFPVYVADNGSTDGSVALLQHGFPTVRLVTLPVNEGYAGGYNTALNLIAEQFGGARYYVLLNSDVEVTPNWIQPVLALLEANPQIAACQPKIRAFHQRESFEYAGAAGGYLDWLGFAFCRGRLFDTLEIDHGQYNDNRPVFWATGACLFVKASVFKETGGFDASFFAHMEEIDWCWRVQRLGYQVWVCGSSHVFHVGGGTLDKSNPRKTYLNYRNSLYMLYKNLPTGQVFGTLLLRLVVDGLSSIRFVLAGEWRNVVAVIQAHFGFYGQLSQLKEERSRLQQTTTSKAQTQLYPKSIVWDYFVRQRKTFSQLNWKLELSPNAC